MAVDAHVKSDQRMKITSWKYFFIQNFTVLFCITQKPMRDENIQIFTCFGLEYGRIRNSKIVVDNGTVFFRVD